MLRSTPFHRENYSHLIVGVIHQFYQRCNDRFKGQHSLIRSKSVLTMKTADLANRDQAEMTNTEGRSGFLKTAAAWAEAPEVNECMAEIRKIAVRPHFFPTALIMLIRCLNSRRRKHVCEKHSSGRRRFSSRRKGSHRSRQRISSRPRRSCSLSERSMHLSSVSHADLPRTVELTFACRIGSSFMFLRSRPRRMRHLRSSPPRRTTRRRRTDSERKGRTLSRFRSLRK